MPPTHADVPQVAPWRLFLRFLRFGCLAWGGPVAQIDLIRQELVDEGHWVTPERFRRVLAIYQALPGPEATELCVYFGMLAGGRLGGALAGLGFVLPGWILMTLFSWMYVRSGLGSPALAALFLGFKPAVAALVVRAVVRIGRTALRDRWLWAIAAASAAAQFAGVHFIYILLGAGVIHAALRRDRGSGAPALVAVGRLAAWGTLSLPGLLVLFGVGLRAGLLSFGGAYTAIPILRHDAVLAGGWMTDAQFLDGLALGGVLPAPLVIFATFVGYLGAGLAGSVVMTLGVFLPAFLITLIAHDQLEQLVLARGTHALLDGVMAGVVGLIAATSVGLLRSAVPDALSLVLFGGALAALFLWRSKASLVAVVLGSGLTRWILGG